MNGMISTFQQQAYEYIRGLILNLSLKPGEWVTDSQIAQQLNFSRTPVREAFHRLEKEGLLVNKKRRGWKVYTLSLKDINEIFDIKVAVEGMIARKAAECKNENLRVSLSKALEKMQIAADSGNIEEWLKSDVRLHSILFEMAGNERARRIITNVNDQWHRLRIGFTALEGRMKQSTAEHQVFVESISRGNGDSAARSMNTHLNRVRDELVALLVNLVLPFVEEGV
jgi:DNA-binding GntR family transcriptional regulator